jgi:hypothetical protein
MTSAGVWLAKVAVKISSPQKLSAARLCRVRARERATRKRGVKRLEIGGLGFELQVGICHHEVR